MKIIKTFFIGATILIGLAACRNESVVLDAPPSCEDLVIEAKVNLNVANARFAEVTRERSTLTSERNGLLKISNIPDPLTLQSDISNIELKINDFDEEIKDQRDRVVFLRGAYADSIQACPSVDQSLIEGLNLEGSDLNNEIDKIKIVKESAREIIDQLDPMIVEVYAEIEELKVAKQSAQDERKEVLASNRTVDQMLSQIQQIDAEIESIDEELLQARRRHAQYSSAKKMAYLTFDTSASAISGLEDHGQNGVDQNIDQNVDQNSNSDEGAI